MLRALQGNAKGSQVSKTQNLKLFSHTAIDRPDRTFFNRQIAIKKQDTFDKMVPAWASDLNLLAQIVKLQFTEVRSKYFKDQPTEKRLAISGNVHPVSFSWSFWD